MKTALIELFIVVCCTPNYFTWNHMALPADPQLGVLFVSELKELLGLSAHGNTDLSDVNDKLLFQSEFFAKILYKCKIFLIQIFQIIKHHVF